MTLSKPHLKREQTTSPVKHTIFSPSGKAEPPRKGYPSGSSLYDGAFRPFLMSPVHGFKRSLDHRRHHFLRQASKQTVHNHSVLQAGFPFRHLLHDPVMLALEKARKEGPSKPAEMSSGLHDKQPGSEIVALLPSGRKRAFRLDPARSPPSARLIIGFHSG